MAAPSRSYSSIGSPEEPSRPPQADGEQTLACWPPRASIFNTGSSRTGKLRNEEKAQLYLHCTFPLILLFVCVPTGQSDGGVVEAVMKMWPPPAPPKDRDPEREFIHRGSSLGIPQSPSSSSSSFEGNQPIKSTSSRPSDQPDLQRAVSHPGQHNTAATAAVNTSTLLPSGYTFINLCFLTAIDCVHTGLKLQEKTLQKGSV